MHDTSPPSTPYRDLDLEALRAGVRRAEASADADAVEEAAAQEAFGPDWFAFWRWCEGRGFAHATLPLQVHVLVEWLAWAVEELADDELADTLAAIRDRHIDAGLRDHIEALGA